MDVTADRWTFWADRVTTGAPLGPVQVTDAKFENKLSDFGSGSATVAVDQVALSKDDLLACWQWRLWVYYRGQPVWCGCSTGCADTGSATVDLTLTELPGYLTRRVLDTALTYTQVEQTTIAATLAQPVVDVGVVVSADPGTGFLRDRAYAYLEGQSRAELLSALSTVIDGPEFRVEYAQNPTTAAPSCTLRIAYPRVGSTAPDLGLSVPGSAVGFTLGWDADQYRTRTFAVGDLAEGAAADSAKPVRVVDRPQAGVPRLDAVDQWQGVTLATTLTERANTNATVYAAPAAQIKASSTVDNPLLWTYGVGDTVTVNVTDPLLPGGLWLSARLVGRTVDCAAGTVEWTLTTTQPPAQPRKTLSGRLSTLDRQVARMFKRKATEVPG